MFNPGLKVKVKNESYFKNDNSSHVKDLINIKNKIRSFNKPYNTRKEEDVIILPYKEGEDNEIHRNIIFQNNSFNDINIKDIFLLSTDCFTYHQEKTIKDYIQKIEVIKESKRSLEYFVKTKSLERNYLKSNKEVSVKFETNPNYNYFIIITLTNNDVYISQPHSNRTLKHFLQKGKKSYLINLFQKKHINTFLFYIKILFKKNTDKFNKDLIYDFEMYKIDSRIIDDINNKGTHTHSLDDLEEILCNILKQMRKNQNFTENENNKSECKCSSSYKRDKINEALSMEISNQISSPIYERDDNTSKDKKYYDSLMNDSCDTSIDNRNNIVDDVNLTKNKKRKINNHGIQVEKYEEILLYNEIFYNIIVYKDENKNVNEAILVNELFSEIGYYEKYSNNNDNMFLIIDGIKVLCYNNIDGSIDILNADILKRKINQKKKII
ncbi:hypothetical protein BCR36DRAFT_415703 [Piromyces finnis]|uniref:Uncharacterized protein n=1 Tax=Piromyces finnis TaxID=1754191 RepID=A0A1Y1UY33_9FUNG|nr:hypothetical protein BCR36DRAFT_415703 [Piromyces finnis]|eukprot:ORX43290.1 hypothetical protein BCR36DRAFT_415703 [Piromyces finnis]